MLLFNSKVCMLVKMLTIMDGPLEWDLSYKLLDMSLCLWVDGGGVLLINIEYIELP